MTEHTKTPWHLGMKPGPAIYGPLGEQVAMMHNPLIDYQENLANAAHIVTCVNAHDELVTMLEKCADYYDEQFPNMRFGHPQEIRDLLAKLKGV